MGSCCSQQKSRNIANPLLEGSKTDKYDNKTSINSPSKQNRDNSRHSKEREDTDSNSGSGKGYSPPSIPTNNGRNRIPIRKLSLNTCPAQSTIGPLEFPSAKFGEMKKLGHVVKNWKKRFFVLEGDKLQYYVIGRNNPDSSKFKGELHLEGSTLTDNNETRRITITCADTQMVLEFDHINTLTEWKFALRECIRTANCNSLIRGQRLSNVVSWYNEQYGLYADAASILRTGEMFCLHHADSVDGYVELIPIWLQENASGLGFIMVCNHVTVQSSSAPTIGGADLSTTKTDARTYIEGLEVPYNSITSIMTGSKTEVYHTPEMGGTASTFFSFGTMTDTYVLEVKSRVVRDHWATCIRDVINFIHIPIPAQRDESQQPPKRSRLSRTNSRLSQGGESD